MIHLSPTQTQLAKCIVLGMRNVEIAQHFGRSARAVDTKVNRIRRKLNATGMAQGIFRARLMTYLADPEANEHLLANTESFNEKGQRTVFNAGYQAHLNGLAFEDVPYSKGWPRGQWRKGWRSAQAEKLERAS